jgi:hypothetical protein
MKFPTNLERSLIFALNTKMDDNLLSIINILHLAFWHYESELVGNKPKKKLIGKIAKTILG